jgi:Protein of unknown function (DUF4012)
MTNQTQDIDKTIVTGDVSVGEVTVHEKPKASTSMIIKQINKFKSHMPKWTYGVFIGLFVFVFIFTYFLMVSLSLYKDTKGLVNALESLKTSVSSEDLSVIASALADTTIALARFEQSYKNIYWLRYIPVLGVYVEDGYHGIQAGKHGLEAATTVTNTLTPYADIFGLTGGNNEVGEDTAKDRLDFIVKTIPELLPQADIVIAKIGLIQKEIEYIDPYDYPEKIGDREIRSVLTQYISLFNSTADFAKDSTPLLEAAPYLIGTDSPRYYMVIFQNDKELRPTGGFMTAYSIAKVDKGKFEPVLSSDIYDLDEKYTPVVTAPDPIIQYIKGPYTLSPNLRLRDMNWSPDFEESMALFITEAEKAGINDIDGIIAVDTQFLVELINVIGPVPVAGYGLFTTDITSECNCPQVIYELESFADVEGPIVWSENEPGKIIFAPANYEDRKKIIGPLMNSILATALGLPKEKYPLLFAAGIKALHEKHALLYMLDDTSQAAAVSAGIAGKIVKTDSDYIYINDSNLGGRKSNLYATQEVQHDIVLENGIVKKKVTITYKNPEKYDGWLNSVLPNWVRIYVPEGSKLISIEGLDNTSEPYTEFGKSVFAGYFELRPQGVAKITLTYTLPPEISTNDYSLYIQKQPGTDGFLHTITNELTEKEIVLKTDVIVPISVK